MFVSWNLNLKTKNHFLAPRPCIIGGGVTGKILEVKMVMNKKLKVIITNGYENDEDLKDVAFQMKQLIDETIDNINSAIDKLKLKID